MVPYTESIKPDAQIEIPGFVLERTAKRMKHFFQEQLSAAEADITVDQWVILHLLKRHDGLNQLEIAKASFKDAPTVTRILDLLCKKGLTIRITDDEDRRRFRVSLTEQGRQKIEEVTPIINAGRKKAWQGISREQLGELVQILDAVFENIND